MVTYINPKYEISSMFYSITSGCASCLPYSLFLPLNYRKWIDKLQIYIFLLLDTKNVLLNIKSTTFFRFISILSFKVLKLLVFSY